MMTLYRLVRTIENHSTELAACLLNRVQNSEATIDYREKVSPEDLKERVHEIYHHLGDWLMTKDEFDLEQRYLRIGARRAQQNLPFSQVAWAIVLTKDNLWEFLKTESEIHRPLKFSASWKCFSSWTTSSIAPFTMPRLDMKRPALRWKLSMPGPPHRGEPNDVGN